MKRETPISSLQVSTERRDSSSVKLAGNSHGEDGREEIGFQIKREKKTTTLQLFSPCSDKFDLFMLLFFFNIFSSLAYMMGYCGDDLNATAWTAELINVKLRSMELLK